MNSTSLKGPFLFALMILWGSISNAQMLSTCFDGRGNPIACPPIPPGVILSQDEYMKTQLQSWSPLQVNAWQSLDAPVRQWVAGLVWKRVQREDLERRSGMRSESYTDINYRLDMPPGCQLPAFVAPVRDPSDRNFQNILHDSMTRLPLNLPWTAPPHPGDGWYLWERMEPNFRGRVETQLYDEYYGSQWAQARLMWWKDNNARVQSCIAAARAQPSSARQMAIFTADLDAEDQRIDRYYERDEKSVRESFAPNQAKTIRLQFDKDMDEVDKYTHDMDRSEKPDHEVSDRPDHERSHP